MFHEALIICNNLLKLVNVKLKRQMGHIFVASIAALLRTSQLKATAFKQAWFGWPAGKLYS